MMKYESGENFASMSLRYRMVLDLLKLYYSDIEVKIPELKDGELISSLRKSSYNEATERLLVLFGYGMIDEACLKEFTILKPIKCEDVVAAEKLVLSLENDETRKDEDNKYVEINEKILDLTAFANALRICSATANNEYLTDIPFNIAYGICTSKHAHFFIRNGYCFPDAYLFKFASKYPMLLRYTESTDSLNSLSYDDMSEISDDKIESEVVFKDIKAAAFIEAYIERLFGRDYIEYCINNGDELIADDNKYMEFLKEKKLSFEFVRYNRKHYHFTSRYNHLDYDKIKVEDGNVTVTRQAGENVILRIDASEVTNDDAPRDIVIKILKKDTYTFPSEGTLMKTSYNGTEYMFAYSNGKYSDVDIKTFDSDLVDYKRIIELKDIFSREHLIMMAGDKKSVDIKLYNDGVDYREKLKITDNELEAVKGALKEQLAIRFALERKKSEGLRKMSQLKVEAEQEKRDEAARAAEAEEEKRRKKQETEEKRNGRKKAGEE